MAEITLRGIVDDKGRIQPVRFLVEVLPFCYRFRASITCGKGILWPDPAYHKTPEAALAWIRNWLCTDEAATELMEWWNDAS